jgi:hypothetical protein
LRTHVNEKSALKAYHGYIVYNLRYGIVLWGNSVDLNRAFISQKQCVRAICNVAPMTSCKPLFKKLKLLSLPSLYIFECCVFVKTHPDLFVRKVTDEKSKSSRYPERLLLPKMRTHYYDRNSYSNCIKIYNKLPDSLKVLNVKFFRVKLLKWLYYKCFYSVKEYFNAKIDIV